MEKVRIINSLDQLMCTWTNLGTQSCHPLMGSQIRETIRVIAPGRFRTGDLREEKNHKFQSLNIRPTLWGWKYRFIVWLLRRWCKSNHFNLVVEWSVYFHSSLIEPSGLDRFLSFSISWISEHKAQATEMVMLCSQCKFLAFLFVFVVIIKLY